ncbi:Myblike DNAbinding domain-containing protein [Gryganskiella cystojenkinii]|nr:Myblike DNAbinding domain-containing protein [Gryganskiella cystojenkinii]
MSWVSRAVVRGARTALVSNGIQRSTPTSCGCFLSTSFTSMPSKTLSLPRSKSLGLPDTRRTFTSATDATVSATGTSTRKTGLKKRRKRVNQSPEVIAWTPELDAKVLDLRLEGNSWKEIGAALGVDHNACHTRYMRHLDPSLQQQWNPERIAKLEALVAQDLPWTKVASELFTTQSICREKWASLHADMAAVARRGTSLKSAAAIRVAPVRAVREPLRIYDVGLVSRRRSWCPHSDALLVDMHNRGLSWKQMSTILGSTPQNCYSRYHNRLKAKLDSGWVPMELNLSNTPYYLLPNRPAPVMLVSKPSGRSTAHDVSSTTTATTARNPRGPLALIDDEFLYDVSVESPKDERTWSQQEDEALIEGRKEGLSFQDIGYELGIDTNLCLRRYVLKLSDASKRDNWTPDLEERLLFYVKQGVPWHIISDELGLHSLLCKEKYRELKVMPASQSRSKSDEKSQSTCNKSPSHQQGTAAVYDARQDRLDDDDDDEDYDRAEDSSDGFDDEYEDRGDDIEDEDDDGMSDDGNMEDDDLYLSAGSEDSEGILDDDRDSYEQQQQRSESRKIRSSASKPERQGWDDSTAQRELQKRWTTEEETKLIQHVLKHGTRSWDDLSVQLGGKFTPEECKILWKFLDMPVRPFASSSTALWDSSRESKFWGLWLEHGSDFEAISQKLNGDEETHNLWSSEPNTDQAISPAACEALFKKRVKSRLKGVTEEDADFKEKCVQLALSRNKTPRFQWDKERSVKLQKLVRLRLRTRGFHVDWINWKWVARHIGGGANVQSCSVHWRAIREMETEQDAWSNEDILLLEQGLREVGSGFDQDKVMAPLSSSELVDRSLDPTGRGLRAIQRFYLPHRPLRDIELKYFLLSDKAMQVTVDEYMALQEAVEKYGEDNWDEVVEYMRENVSDYSGSNGSNSARWTKAPCRRVWEASYKSQLNHTPWSTLEDQDLLYSVEKIGGDNWMAVSRFFPGKTAWQCRLRWCQLTDDSSKRGE